MSKKLMQFFLTLVVSCMFVGCGGGGRRSGDGAPLDSNQSPTANTGTAQSVLVGATVSLDGSASADPDHDALAYNWVFTSKPATSAASLANATTSKPTFNADVAGSYVITLTVTDGKLVSPPSAVTALVLPTDTLTIKADKTEPLSGKVQFSLSGSTADAPVSWYIDLNQIGTGISITWDTTTAGNSSHLVVARVQVSADNTVEIRRTVSVSNSSINLNSSVSAVSGTINVDIHASSPNGISSVSSSLDGISIGTLTSPNACARFCISNDIYRFTLDSNTVGSGNHTMIVSATDGASSHQQLNIAVPVSNAPAVNLNGPLDGAFAYGSLSLSGNYVTDKPGLVTVTAKLGDVQFLQTTAQTFNGSYDLAGVATGTYTLTVQATDATGAVTTLTRTVIVTSSSALAYLPLFSLGANGHMLAVSGDQLLYSAEDQSVRLRDTTIGNEVILQGGATLAYAANWKISGGLVYAFGQENDCTINFICIYQWQVDGTRTNLTAGNPWAGTSYQQYPVAHDGLVVWCNDDKGNTAGSYTFFNVASKTYTHVVAPSIDRVANANFDFAVNNGIVNFFYFTQTGTGVTTATDDIYQWRSDTATSTRLSTPGLRSLYPQTDGARVAWSQTPVGSPLGATTSLLAQPLVGGIVTSASSTMSSFLLRDGVLAWIESTTNSRALKASTVNAATTLSIQNSSVLLGAGGGFVIYSELGKTYSWNAATGLSSTLLLNAAPLQALVSANKMYFVMGNTQTLYKVPLN